MSRVMVAPGRWRDDGPATPGRRIHGYASVPVTTVGQMRPLMAHSATFHGNAYTKPLRGERLAEKLYASTRPLCGETLRITGESCARMPGHRDCHRSRVLMDADAVRRRGTGVTGRIGRTVL